MICTPCLLGGEALAYTIGPHSLKVSANLFEQVGFLNSPLTTPASTGYAGSLRMKLLYNAGGVASVVFVAVALCWLYKPGTFSTGQSIAILGFASGIALSFGLYIAQLSGRIAALEKRLRELQ